jgi:hypothetical protein
MLIAPAAALAMLAQAAAPAPAATEQTRPATTTPPPTARAEACPPAAPGSTTIVICTQRPQGYRLNPDVMEAKREMHSGGRPVRPNGVPRPDCATVGPVPCITPGIDLLAAAVTAAEMAKRLASGKEVGSMFLTDPHPSEYQLYQMAKERREQEEAENAAAKARAQAVARAQQARPAQPLPQPSGN